MNARDLNLARHSLKVKDRPVTVSQVGSVFREMLETRRYFQDFLTTEDLAYCRVLSHRKKWLVGSKANNLSGTISSGGSIISTIWRYGLHRCF